MGEHWLLDNPVVYILAPKWIKQSNTNGHNRVKNLKWLEANQLAIYKHNRGIEPGNTHGTTPAGGQSGTWTRDLRIAQVQHPNHSATLPA